MFSGTAVSMVRSGVDPTSNPVSREKAESVAQELLGTLCTGKKTVEVGEAKKTKTSSADDSVTVYNKAGWINGSSDDAICDAGIIEEDGKYYLITIIATNRFGPMRKSSRFLQDYRANKSPKSASCARFRFKPVCIPRLELAATFEKRHLLLYWRNTVKTYYAKPNEVEREWLLIDAEDQVLGRVASKAAHILKGKHKPTYTPHVDTGDFVVIINADKIKISGVKATSKEYYRHSGYPGGLKCETFQEAMQKHPERVIEHAVKGMLPKNTLGRAMGMKLKVYAGAEHPHAAQQPREIKMEDN